MISISSRHIHVLYLNWSFHLGPLSIPSSKSHHHLHLHTYQISSLADSEQVPFEQLEFKSCGVLRVFVQDWSMDMLSAFTRSLKSSWIWHLHSWPNDWSFRSKTLTEWRDVNLVKPIWISGCSICGTSYKCSLYCQMIAHFRQVTYVTISCNLRDSK